MIKKIIQTLLIGCAFITLPYTCYAAEKTLTANLGKEYTTVKFNIKFDEPGEYDVTIKGPDESLEYKATQIDSNNATCVVQDAMKGQWTIGVVTSDEPNEDGIVPEIGGVHVEIEGSAKELAEVSTDIKVAADIAGLNMYFRDNIFVAEWSEGNNGSINIEITDSKTQERIVSNSVNDNKFEVEIDPQEHEGIIVTMVPSESSNIADAERRWTMTTQNEPDAFWTFPNEDITNKDNVQAKVSLGKDYYIEVYLNDRRIYKSELMGAGEYEIDLETEIGDNNYSAYVIDPETHYMRSTPYHTVKDVVAPAIRLNRSYENVSTEEDHILIEGTIDPDYVSFTINDADVKVEGDHSFSYDYLLKEGTNNIKLLATDAAGNVTEYNTVVNRVVPQSGKSMPWLSIIIVICVIGFGATVLYSLFTKGKTMSLGSGIGHFSRSASYEVLDPKIAFIIRVMLPVIFVIIMVTKIVAPTTVASGSMEPKLAVGNYAVYNRLAYKKHEPERGDIILFKSTEKNKDMAKRVIGIPGDHIEFIDGYVFINGQRVDESEYIAEGIETNCSEVFDVPQNTVFVMGDNREYSADSRYFNQPYIPYKDIIGKFMGQTSFNLKYLLQKRAADLN